jgi:hypothetical protein
MQNMKVQSVLSAVAIAGMLVITADYATMAATGGSFILGHANSANQTTALTNTGSGAVLKLSTTHPATRPPLGVNSHVKVANLNADLLDGLSSSVFAQKRAPLKVWMADPLPGRSVSVVGDTVVQSLAITVPGECGPNTRHTYLLEHDAWWFGTDAVAEISLTLNSYGHQFGPGSSVVEANSYASSASSRVLVLAPGADTLRLIADAYSGTNLYAYDPTLRATDLGYTCAGGPVSRVGSSRLAGPGR